jgi:F-type H+-transporting ATPase subunit delta
MTARTAARRYAGALFDVVQKQGNLDSAERDVLAMRDLVTGHDQLRRVFETPAVPIQKKRAVIEAILSAAGSTSPEVRRMLLMLADRDRLALLPDIAEAFAERTMAARRVLPAEVVTAVPLDDARRAAVTYALARAAGCDVTLSERVDPAIIGGMIARVGSTVYDASVTRQLEKMRQQLLDRN